MPATSVIGLQWGDEAKGKIVDLLTEDHDIVVRYQGGNNAGHTVQFDGQTYKLSLLPAGILRPGVESVVTGGVVINPRAFLEVGKLHDRPPELFAAFMPLIGEHSIQYANGAVGKERHRLMAKAFTKKAMSAYFDELCAV